MIKESDRKKFTTKLVKAGVVQEIIESCNAHVKKHCIRIMSLKELDKLCGSQ
ncbi:MAG: hypothetical protein AABW86_05175 [Candidatus Micrarchaeota archaeon]